MYQIVCRLGLAPETIGRVYRALPAPAADSPMGPRNGKKKATEEEIRGVGREDKERDDRDKGGELSQFSERFDASWTA